MIAAEMSPVMMVSKCMSIGITYAVRNVMLNGNHVLVVAAALVPPLR